MAVQNFPDGITIGPITNNPSTDRLPIFEFDEWLTPDGVEVGTLAAGEIKEIEITGVLNVRDGQTILKCRPAYADVTTSNFQHLLTLDAWPKPLEPSTIVVRVKNIHSAEITVTTDPWKITHLNTSNP